MTFVRRLSAMAIVSMLVLATATQFLPGRSFALSGSEFRSGRIIDDAIFYDASGMSPADIQKFLEAKVPSCDTNGTKIYSGTTTRAEYGTSRGYPPPYTCMRHYSQTTTNKTPESGLCSGHTAGSKTAAQIIYEVSQSCGISAKVLLVLLQKEQSLITDDWPWSIQYRSATGYGCPDTAPCNEQYYGFFNQVYEAARAFKRYGLNPTAYNYRANRWNNILYNPNTACGSSSVYIENQATANLYIYTPYQPNQAALNNLYGSGDTCSAYGNRNFWRMYNDWFGTTLFVNLPGCQEATNTTISCVWALRNVITDEQVLVSNYDERNTLIANQGHRYDGVIFYGTAIQQRNNIPVYRLKKPNGSTFLTTSTVERNNLISSQGFSSHGIVFYADPAGGNSGYPVYRMYNPTLNKHAWIVKDSDFQALYKNGYRSEGIAFNSVSLARQEWAPPTGQLNVYRFANMPGNSHFYTTRLEERDRMIFEGYTYEGVAWNSSTSTLQKPVYRLYSPPMRKHLYTTDLSEKNVLAASGSWNYEGIGQYMSKTTTSRPVYRLYSPVTTNHFWTSSAPERDYLVKTGNFRYEGIAWYQP